MAPKSSPSRGTWIEIILASVLVWLFWGRPPHGGRGLKSGTVYGEDMITKSSPSRGTWIEIGCRLDRGKKWAVVPLTGDVD